MATDAFTEYNDSLLQDAMFSHEKYQDSQENQTIAITSSGPNILA